MSHTTIRDRKREVRFQVGDKVVYSIGSSAKKVGLSKTVEATIESISLGFHGIPYSEPLYTIAWPPKGRARVFAHDLTAPSSADAAGEPKR